MTNEKSSTGSLLGDIVKATRAGGASSMTKKVTVGKNQTLSDIAEANNTTLAKVIKLNPQYKTGLDKGSPTKGVIKQKTIKVGTKILIPDPHTFKKGRLTKAKIKPKNVYNKTTTKQLKEMNVPLKKKKKVK